MIRISEYPVNHVLNYVVISQKGKRIRLKDRSKLEYDGHLVKMNSLRLRTFAIHGTACIECGIKGSFFALEKHSINADRNVAHFNLYALDSEGNEVLMTKDHILPVSKGGKNTFANLQTMCAKCNVKKGNTIIGETK